MPNVKERLARKDTKELSLILKSSMSELSSARELAVFNSSPQLYYQISTFFTRISLSSTTFGFVKSDIFFKSALSLGRLIAF